MRAAPLALRIALVVLSVPGSACRSGTPGRDARRAATGRSADIAVVGARVDTVATDASSDSTADEGANARAYEGVDERGIPNYASIAISSEDSLLLRRAYGIEDPHRLYVSDSTEEGLLKYDTQRKRCRTCYVNSYRVGFVSVRRPDESWEQAERRVRASASATFTGGSRPSSVSTRDLDPEVQPQADAMLRDARAAGFRLRVTATYRSPLREAFLMAEGHGRTHTLTSNHSYGRALDIVIGDGHLGRTKTRNEWIAFRRWVTRYRTPSGVPFRVLGRIDHTWDWPHVELPSPTIGFGSIAEATAHARRCLTPDARESCDFPPHLPPSISR